MSATPVREEKPPSALGANLSFVRELQEMKVRQGGVRQPCFSRTQT